MLSRQGEGVLRSPDGSRRRSVRYDIVDSPERWSGHLLMDPDGWPSESGGWSQGQHVLVLEDGTECVVELLSDDAGLVAFRGVGAFPRG